MGLNLQVKIETNAQSTLNYSKNIGFVFTVPFHMWFRKNWNREKTAFLL